ncbi:MAG: 30S ribosome-binding factor RbfA [Phycisphaerae bacterium]
MAYRAERMASIIREVVSDAIANHLSDPRISRFTSVTRVDLSPDLEHADVSVSVMGNEREARTTMRGLASARGAVQTLVAKRLDVRKCPSLRFKLDEGIKKGVAIVQELDRLAAERNARLSPVEGPAAEPDGPDRADSPRATGNA